MAKKNAISAKTQTPAAKEKQVIAEFEKHIYDLQQMLEISKSFCSTIEFSPLIESILYVAMAQMRVTGGSSDLQELGFLFQKNSAANILSFQKTIRELQ